MSSLLRNRALGTVFRPFLRKWNRLPGQISCRTNVPRILQIFAPNFSEVNKRGRPSKWPPERLLSKFADFECAFSLYFLGENMTPNDPFLEGTFWDKFWRPIRSRELLFTPENFPKVFEEFSCCISSTVEYSPRIPAIIEFQIPGQKKIQEQAR